MRPELKAELRRLRERRFYYLSKKIPEGMWRDGEGKFHDMQLMGIDHLQACIRLIERDLTDFNRKLVSPQAVQIIEARALAKKEELIRVFREKSRM